MWDLETIKHMNTPEEIEKSRNRAHSMNKVSYSTIENSVGGVRPFVYAYSDKLLMSSQKSDMDFAEREVRKGKGTIKYISRSVLRKPIHGGRTK